jgi:hypothetical protein
VCTFGQLVVARSLSFTIWATGIQLHLFAGPKEANTSPLAPIAEWYKCGMSTKASFLEYLKDMKDELGL